MSITTHNGIQYIQQQEGNKDSFRAGEEVYLLDQEDNVIGNADIVHKRGELARRLGDHSVTDCQDAYATDKEMYIVIRFLSVLPHGIDSPYMYVTPDVTDVETIGDMVTGRHYFWDLNKLRPLRLPEEEDPIENAAVPTAPDEISPQPHPQPQSEPMPQSLSQPSSSAPQPQHVDVSAQVVGSSQPSQPVPAEGEDVDMTDLSPRGFLELEQGEEEEVQEEEDRMEVISIGSEEEGVKESKDAFFDTEDEIVAKDISISSGIEAALFDVSV